MVWWSINLGLLAFLGLVVVGLDQTAGMATGLHS